MQVGQCSRTENDVDFSALRKRFPSLRSEPEALFLDNASTTQKPDSVLAVIEDYYRTDCANAGRAVYPGSLRASQAIEKARSAVADFIGACPDEIAFTAGATDSLNLVVWCWALTNLKDGDEIMLCMQDHSAAVAPWLNIQSVLAGFGKNVSIKTFDIHAVGDYDLRSIKNALSEKTRVISLSHIHHVFGLDMEVGEIRRIVGPQVVISLDASQSIAHTAVDARILDVDFISFSGHKAFAGNGVGVLYAAKARHSELVSCRVGGHGTAALSEIRPDARAGFIDKVEAGTLNIPSIASLSSAIAFMQEIGMPVIERYLGALTALLVEKLKGLPGIVFAPGPVPCGCPGGFGILSFRFEHVSSFDLACALANEKIYVRSGDHCRASGPAAEQEDDFIRVSLQIYNQASDIEILAGTLENLVS